MMFNIVGLPLRSGGLFVFLKVFVWPTYDLLPQTALVCDQFASSDVSKKLFRNHTEHCKIFIEADFLTKHSQRKRKYIWID